MDGRADEMLQARQRDAWHAWHVAALQRSKTMPSLRSIMPRRRQAEQSLEEQMALMQRWAADHNKALDILRKLDDGGR